MKSKIQKEYFRRIRKLLETKLNSRKLIKGINTWAVSFVRYSGPFLKWTRDKLRQMDERTRKLMTMHKALHPRDDVERLYVLRKEGGRRLSSVEDNVDTSIQRLENYIEKHERGLITAIRNNTDNTIDNRMTKTRKQKWEVKQLHGRFKRLINNILHDKTWTWLRKGNFKRETESLLMAAQNSAIRTNHIKARIDKTQQNSKCRLCGDRNETINHITSECSKLHRRSTRRDTIGWARYSPGKCARNLNLTMPTNGICTTQHRPRKLHTQTPVRLLYTNGSPNLGPKTRSYNNQQKKKKKKREKIWKVVDFDVPADHRIKLKKSEKRDKYLDLARDLKKLWNMKVTIIPIVIGAFGTVTKGLLKGQEDLEVGGRVETIQTTALLKTARILRRVLETWGDLLSLNLLWKPSDYADVKNSNE